jgi:hypothetical protein
MQIPPKPNAPRTVAHQIPHMLPQPMVKTAFSALLMPRATPKQPASPTHQAKTHGTKDQPTTVEEHPKRGHSQKHSDDDLDPTARHAAQLAPFAMTAPATAVEQASAIAKSHVSLEDLVPALVRKIAWAGDGRRGSVRIELGAGELAGGVLVVHADDGKVRVELSVPNGVDAGEWKERLERRLTARGLDLDTVEVR